MTTFPLLQLPSQKVIIRVLQCMNGPELLLLSLLSQKTKTVVKSVQLKAPKFIIKVGSRISFLSLYRSMYINFHRRPEQKTLDRPPEKVWIHLRRGDSHPYMVLHKNTLKLDEWLEHCQYIFNCSEPHQLNFDPEYRNTVDLEILKALLRKHKYLLVAVKQERITVAQQILRTFLPDVRNLSLDGNPFLKGDTRHQKLLCQNFESLGLGFQQDYQRISLNDLLICNASTLNLSPNQNFKWINEFLKLWIKGANPRLRMLKIFQTTPVISDDVIRGIRIIKKIPAEEAIIYDNLEITSPNRRAMDIRRYDGTRGTIIIQCRCFWFLVWN
ncbi:unnamed protein product [Caenorhabditis brenneri]